MKDTTENKPHLVQVIDVSACPTSKTTIENEIKILEQNITKYYDNSKKLNISRIIIIILSLLTTGIIMFPFVNIGKEQITNGLITLILWFVFYKLYSYPYKKEKQNIKEEKTKLENLKKILIDYKVNTLEEIPINYSKVIS